MPLSWAGELGPAADEGRDGEIRGPDHRDRRRPGPEAGQGGDVGERSWPRRRRGHSLGSGWAPARLWFLPAPLGVCSPRQEGVPLSKFTRSAVSNGTRLHQDRTIDPRGGDARRLRDLVYALGEEVGGFDALGEGDRWAVRSAAALLCVWSSCRRRWPAARRSMPIFSSG